MKKSIFLLSAAAGLSLSAADPVNLLDNGGLENWKTLTTPPRMILLKDNLAPDMGTQGGLEGERPNEPMATGERDETVKRSGKYSLKITNPSFDNITKVLQYNIPVEGNTKYIFRCYVKGQGIDRNQGKSIGVWAGFNAGPDKTFWSDNKGTLFAPKFEGDFDWQKVEVEVTTRENDNRGMIQVQLRNAKGTLWIDDLELIEAPKAK